MSADQVRRSGDRFRTGSSGVDSRHSFSFGRHYDPANTSFGSLVLHDEHALAAGAGFDLHAHRDVEVVTWVLDGVLRHEDSTGRRGELRPGSVQRMSAGSGVQHAERAGGVPTRFVQAWVVPDEPGGEPEHAQCDVGELLRGGGLVRVVSGRHDDVPVRLRSRHAALHVGRLAAGEQADLPDAPFVHLFVSRGTVSLEGAGPLVEGDAGRLTGARRLTAREPAEVLVWEMHTALGSRHQVGPP
jgi:redox-sensitive bicupin YhaK (pirin superfamily)